MNYLLKNMLNHIAIAYLYNDLEIASSLLMDSLKISDESGQYITQKYGHFLYYEIKEKNNKIPTELLERLLTYWEQRKKSNLSDSELTSFELWFMSDQFDKTWSINNLLNILKKVTSIQPNHEIVNSVSSYTDEFPNEVIQCIRELLEKDKFYSFIYDSKETIKNIMAKLLEKEDDDIKMKTQLLINEFGRRGNTSFRDLLT